VRKVLSPALLMAVTTNTRSPETIGLAVEMPGIGVFQRTLRPLSRSHSTTAPWPSPLPLALSPRKPVQGRGAVRGAGFSAAGSGLPSGAGVAAGVGAAAAAALTRSNGMGPPPWFSSMRSTIPPRPAKVNVICSNSAARKAVVDVGMSVSGGPPAAAAVSWLPDSSIVITMPCSFR
jgi:hypothetical protein